ncbi:hypothetical protein KQI63_08000 [bacterium]|nr:hypothetical protein [bacterium]
MRQIFRQLLPLLLLFPAVVYGGDVPLEKQDYLDQRAQMIELDRSSRRSASLELDEKELAADAALERLKQEWDTLATWQYPPANRFHEVRAAYDASPLLPIMDALPKGGMLHAHPSATGSFDMLLEATYDPHVYIYQGRDTLWLPTGALRWAKQPPGPKWSKVIYERGLATDKPAFDRELIESITLGLEDYGKGDIWDHFEGNFSRMWGLESNPAVWRDYMANTCRELAEQNVQYVEFHTYVDGGRKANGRQGTPEETVENWISIRDEIRQDHPNFDLKLVGSISRWSSVDRVRDYLRTVVDLKITFPTMIVGYDLVSEEDQAATNLDMLDALLDAHRYADSLGVELRPCIHSGESNRLDNENLFDAFLLDAKRIGHGYALWTHPSLVERAIKKDVAVEICPISNQALGYVVDLRNHPAVEYLARGVPIVLSPDDPGMMRYRWAYDWVAATSAWDLSIADIKQMILDSFTYSGMNDEEHKIALEAWEREWADWVEMLASK